MVGRSVLSTPLARTLSVRRWVFILLVLCLLLTASLLLGVTLQHFQLLSKVAAEKRSSRGAKASPAPAAKAAKGGGGAGEENSTAAAAAQDGALRPAPSLGGRLPRQRRPHQPQQPQQPQPRPQQPPNSYSNSIER